MSRKRKRSGGPRERRALAYGPVPLNDSHTLFGNYPMTSTGLRVDNYSAMCNAVFRRGVEVIAEAMGKLSKKWRLSKGEEDAREYVKDQSYHLLTVAANQYTTSYNFWVLLQSWAKGWGNGYAWILRRGNLEPVALYPLHPSRVMPRLIRSTDPKSSYPWDLIYQIDGGQEVFLPYEILHIKGNPGFDGVQGYNLVQLHENTLAISQAQNEYAGEFFQNGAVAGGLVELPPHLKPDVVQKYRADFQNQYSSRGNRHKLAVVDSGVKFSQTTISPDNAQLLASRQFSVFEIALMLGVPPAMLGDLSHGTYANSEQQQIAFNTLTIHPTCENWRQELDMKMTLADDLHWLYDLRGLDAADTSARMSYLSTAVGGPWMSLQEARAEEGLPQEISGIMYPPPNMNTAPGEEGEDEETEAEETEENEEQGEDAEAAEEAGGEEEEEEKPKRKAKENRAAKMQAQREMRSHRARQRALSAMAPVFRDVAGRLMRKEGRAVGNLIDHLRKGNTETFLAKVEDFCNRQYEAIRDSYLPSLLGLAAQVRHAISDELHLEAIQPDDLATVYAAKMATRHCDFAKRTIGQVLADNQDPQAAADAMQARMAHWAAHQPDDRSAYELHQAGNYFARETYKASGCQNVRWLGAGCGPDCAALDGKRVSMDQPFVEEPKRWHPPLNSDCRCGIIAD